MSTFKCSSLVSSRNATLNTVFLTKATAAQASSVTTGVTLNSPSGFISTFSAGSIATSGSVSFTVSNSYAHPTSLILTSVNGYSGSGIPLPDVTSVTEGSFVVNVKNLDATNAISTAVKVGYTIF